MILIHTLIVFVSRTSSKRYNRFIMILKCFGQLHQEALELLGISLSDQQLTDLEHYASELITWNQVHNLTAITAAEQVRHKHFLDSLSCLLLLPDAPGRVIDVGSGAGFPGLVLRIVRPQMQLTLVDSNAKKTAFLSHIVAELQLDGVTIINSRVEVLGQELPQREQYDWALARALARMPTLLEYLLPLVCVGGNVLAQKGAGVQQEIDEAARALQLLGGRLQQLLPVPIPGGEEHYLVLVDKTQPTPTKYPRREGIPNKRPL